MFELPDVNSKAVPLVPSEVGSLPEVEVEEAEKREERGSVEGTEVAVKNASSETSERGRVRVLALGGGVTLTSFPRRGPLETVTGEPSPRTVPPTKLNPKPRPGFAFLARLTAEANSSSRSVKELVRRRELLRLGAMTRGSPGYTYDWLDTAASSIVRV